MAAATDNQNQRQNIPTSPLNSDPAAADYNSQHRTSVKSDPINLLPSELKPKKYVIKLAKTLNKIALVSLLVFVILAAVMSAAIFFLGNRVGIAERRNEELSNQIRALEQSEQRLMLVRDRLEKITNVLSSTDNAYDSFLVFDKIYSNLPAGIELSQVDVEKGSATIGVIMSNSSDLSRFLATIMGDPEFTAVNMNSLELTPDNRLELIITISS